MCLKYITGSLKTHSKDAIYHRLDKNLKFSTTRMKCAQDDQGEFSWVVMWAIRVKGKEWTINLGNVELLSQVTMEQPTKHQETNKCTNAPNLNNIMNIS